MYKDCEQYFVRIEGHNALIMQNCDSADPLNEYTRKLSTLKSKRKKTDCDMKEIEDLAFKSCLYWDNEEMNGLYMPVDNVRKMFLEAARSLDQRHAKKQIVGIFFDTNIGWPLEVRNRDNMNALTNDPNNRYRKIVTIQKAKVPSIRAVFRNWGFSFNIWVDSEIVNPSTVEEWLEYASFRIGLGCRRPYAPTPGQFGTFRIMEFKKTT